MRVMFFRQEVTIAVTEVVLQIMPDVLGDECGKCPVEVFFLAHNAMHVSIAYGFHILAPPEAERQIGAFEALSVFPDIEPMGLTVVN